MARVSHANLHTDSTVRFHTLYFCKLKNGLRRMQCVLCTGVLLAERKRVEDILVWIGHVRW